MKTFSHVASWVFLPLLMPLYALLSVMYIGSYLDVLHLDHCMAEMHPKNKIYILVYYGVFGALLPAFSYMIMRLSGMISTIEMDDKSERGLPIMVMIAYCTVLYVFLLKLFEGHDGVPKFIFRLALSGIIVSVFHLILNTWKKVSIHAGGAGIAFGYLLAFALSHNEFNLWIIILPIIASGIVMTARLYLRKHDMTEVIVGWFLGSFVTFVITYLY